MLLFVGLIFSVLSFVVPIAIVVLIVRAISSRRNDKHRKKISLFREAMLGLIILAGGYAGVAGLYMLPLALLGEDSGQETIIMSMHLISAIILLISGLLVQRVTGKFLMVVGLILLLVAIGPMFSALGSVGAFMAVLLAFVALVVITIHVSRKAKT